MVNTTHRTKVVITEPSDHGFDKPPHCKNKVKHISETNRMLKPGRSRRTRISFHVACRGFCFTRRKRTCRRIAVPPMGKLIQKHQRHVSSVVKTPPIKGPIMVENMRVPIQVPRRRGRFFGSATRLIMVAEPPRVPCRSFLSVVAFVEDVEDKAEEKTWREA
jgi:hypothetical protein